MLQQLYSHLVVKPLRTLYEYGPEILGVGFWGGKTPSQICAALTGTPEDFWAQNPVPCSSLIDRKFLAVQVTLEAVAHFACMYAAASLVLSIVVARARGSSQRIVFVRLPEDFWEEKLHLK
jgi:hypothetical protein